MRGLHYFARATCWTQVTITLITNDIQLRDNELNINRVSPVVVNDTLIGSKKVPYDDGTIIY